MSSHLPRRDPPGSPVAPTRVPHQRCRTRTWIAHLWDRTTDPDTQGPPLLAVAAAGREQALHRLAATVGEQHPAHRAIDVLLDEPAWAEQPYRSAHVAVSHDCAAGTEGCVPPARSGAGGTLISTAATTEDR